MNHFPIAIEKLLQAEGGYVNDPIDPGGETKYGISKRAYPGEDIKNLSKARASEIYFKDYWLKNSLDKLDSLDVAAAALDTVVNHGRGPWLIQGALQKLGIPVTVDGRIGKVTLDAINKTPPKDYLQALYDVRRNYYEGLVAATPAKAKFLKGWLARISKFGTPTTTAAGMGIAGMAAIIAGIWYYLKRRGSV